LVLISLLFIFILGLFLRTYRLSEFMYWGDPARDTLVAKRISEGGKPRFIAPYAAGGGGLIFNSPFYYNFLAVLWTLFGSSQGLVLTFVIFNSLVILVNYKIGEELGSKELGLIIAFITAISSFAVHTSRSSFQPFLLPLFFSLVIYFIIRFYRTYHWTDLAASIFLFFLCFHIHYSILAVSIAIFPWLLFSIYRYFSKSKNRFNTLMLSLFVFFNFEVWFFMTNLSNSFNLYNFFVFHLKKTMKSDHMSLSGGNILKIFDFIFEESVEKLSWLPFILMVFVVCGMIYKLYSLFKNKKKKFEVYLFLFVSFSTLALTTLFSLKIDSTYLMPYYYLFFILLGIVIYEISKKKKLISIALLFFISYHLQLSNYYYFEEYPWNEFGQFEYVSKKVIEDAESNSLDLQDFIIFEKTKSVPTYNWNAPGFFYFLEDYYQVKLLKLYYDFNNLWPIYTHPKVIYLACREFEFSTPQEVKELCLLPLIKKFDGLMSEDYQVLVDKNDLKTGLELYKFKLNLGDKPLFWAF